MTAVEIKLIIVGIVFLLVSFLVQEKLSPKDIESITNLSENELKIIVEKQLKNANDQVEDAITDVVEDKTETTKRALEKETNEKIMAIDEYSNTVLESMNKTHNEILFLYSMLNDKHTELTDLATQLQQFSEHMKNTENEVLLPRTVRLAVDSMELISPHKIRMMAREVITDETGATADSASTGVRNVRESTLWRSGLRPVSERNSEEVLGQGGGTSGRNGSAGLPGLREGEGSGSMGGSGVESDYRAAEEGLKYQPREQSVSDRRRSRYCQRTEFELLFARGRGRIDTYRHKRRTDHGRKEKANFQRDSALRGADARLIYGRD